MPRAGLSTDVVVRAAADLADDRGACDISIADLARHFGVKPASLYSHVSGSADLQARLARLALDELADLASEALAGRSGTEALVAFANTYRDYARDHPGRYAAARLPLAPDSPAVAAARRHADLTRALLRGYRLPPVAETEAVRFLGSLLHGYASLELGGSFDHSDPPSDATWPRMLDAADHVLRHWPQG